MRRKTKVKAKGRQRTNAQHMIKKIERYTQLSLKGDVLGYFGSPLFKEDTASLNPKDRLMVFSKLLEYVFPKLQATAVDFTSNDPSTREGANRIIELSKRFPAIGTEICDTPQQIPTLTLGYAELVE